jgi:hypothetical protein
MTKKKLATIETIEFDEDAKRKAAAARRRHPVGIYLRVKVREEVERIADAKGLSIHALLAFAVSDFVRRYKAGKVRIETVRKTVLKLDV